MPDSWIPPTPEERRILINLPFPVVRIHGSTCQHGGAIVHHGNGMTETLTHGRRLPSMPDNDPYGDT